MMENARKFLKINLALSLVLIACMYGAGATNDWDQDRLYITKTTEENKDSIKDLAGKLDQVLTKVTEIEKQMAVLQEKASYRAMLFGAGGSALIGFSSLLIVIVSNRIKRGK